MFQINIDKSRVQQLGSRMAILTAAMLLTGCLATSNTPETERGAFGIPKNDVETAGLNFIKGEQKVILTGFKVVFSTKVTESARSSALFSMDSSSMAMSGVLMGIAPKTFQQITDAAYSDFLKKLRATGMEVITAQDLQSSPLWKQMRVESSPMSSDNEVIYAPTGMKLVLFPGEDGVSSAFSGFDTSNPLRVLPQLAKEKGAGYMNVTYYIDFLNSSNSGTTLVMGGAAKVSYGQGISVRAGSGIKLATLQGMSCVGYCPNSTSRIDLGQALYSQEAYGETRDVTSTTFNAMGAISGLVTGTGFKRKDIEIDADPVLYAKTAEGLIDKTNTVLIDTLKQARQ